MLTPPGPSHNDCPNLSALSQEAQRLRTSAHTAVIQSLSKLTRVDELRDATLPPPERPRDEHRLSPEAAHRLRIVDVPIADGPKVARAICWLQRDVLLTWLDRQSKDPKKGYITADEVAELKKKLAPESGYEILAAMTMDEPPRILGFMLYRIVDGSKLKIFNGCDESATTAGSTCVKTYSPLAHALWNEEELRANRHDLSKLKVAIDVECVIDSSIEDPVEDGGLDIDRFAVYKAMHGRMVEELIGKGVSLAFATYRTDPAPNPVGTTSDRDLGYRALDPEHLQLHRYVPCPSSRLLQRICEAILWLDTTSQRQIELIHEAHGCGIPFENRDPSRRV